MLTLTLTAPGEIALSDTPDAPMPGAGEALIQIHRVGICGTDIHAWHGRQPFFSYPRILGHELGVEVLAVGADVSHVKPGDRCAVEPYLNCGTCIACRRGKTNCCETLQTLGVHTDGGMRERIVIRANKLHPANDLSYDTLALIETLGIGAHAVGRAGLANDDSVLVLGAGPIGLSVLQFATLEAPRVFVADISAARLGFAGAHFGVQARLNAGDGLVDAVRAANGGDLPTVVFDATGNAASMRAAFDLVAPGGKLVFVGLVQAEIGFQDPHLHRREITLYASRNALPREFERIIALTRAGRIDTRPWITHRSDPAGFPDAMRAWTQPQTGVVKGMLAFT
jgi:2-desacetyl-2-hydroxyethyl bacteriochlorophyllide A dehydrogenase